MKFFTIPKWLQKKLVDHVFKIANKRDSVVRLLAMAKSAIRHNMSKDVPQLNFSCLPNLGKQDGVTPPHVAEEFHRLFRNLKVVLDRQMRSCTYVGTPQGIC